MVCTKCQASRGVTAQQAYGSQYVQGTYGPRATPVPATPPVYTTLPYIPPANTTLPVATGAAPSEMSSKAIVTNNGMVCLTRSEYTNLVNRVNRCNYPYPQPYPPRPNPYPYPGPGPRPNPWVYGGQSGMPPPGGSQP